MVQQQKRFTRAFYKFLLMYEKKEIPSHFLPFAFLLYINNNHRYHLKSCHYSDWAL
jgi:hypothetical protein